MKRLTMLWTGGVLIGIVVLNGCAGSNTLSSRHQVLEPSAVTQGMLGDLNQYVHQLLGQQKAGNAEAGKVLVRLLSGNGLPECNVVTATRRP
ncbi:hypothetical protein AH137_001270 [Salmonella enterica subsp. enterica serovar Urbana]|nr:hypothetical protein [Salmonella enterica subsp. enterica serovar Chester]EGI5934735.1 hypothetical protein [Salmonella enterica subsp. enterica serovar Urbana]MLT46674.1 hypothetical protein [Salmonella enterica subsp. enterica serovar Chester]